MITKTEAGGRIESHITLKMALENGSIYILKTEVIKKYNNRLGGKIALYLMPLWQSFEIDKKEDMEICE